MIAILVTNTLDEAKTHTCTSVYWFPNFSVIIVSFLKFYSELQFGFCGSGNEHEEEPSDAETIESESSVDDIEEVNDADSETEQTTETEEQVVSKLEKRSWENAADSVNGVKADDMLSANPAVNEINSNAEKENFEGKSLEENFSGETAGRTPGANDITVGNVVSTYPVISESNRAAEHNQKIDLLLYGRLRRQRAAKNSRPAVTGVLQSDPVSVRMLKLKRSLVSLKSDVPQTTTVASTVVGGIYSVTASVCSSDTARCTVNNDQKLALESTSSTVCGPCMQSSVAYSMAQKNSASLATSTASSMIPAVAPAESLDSVHATSASVVASAGCLVDSDQKPLVLPAMESGESSTSGLQIHSSVASSVAQISTVFRKPSTTSSMKSRRIVPTFCGSVAAGATAAEARHVTVVPKEEHESSNSVVNRTFIKVCVDSEFSDQTHGNVASVSFLKTRHNSSYCMTAAGPGTSEVLTVANANEPRQSSSVDVESSLGKSIVVADVADWVPPEKPVFEAVAPASQRDIIHTFNRLRQMCSKGSLSPPPPTKQEGSVFSQRQSAAPKPAFRQWQGEATKTVSALLQQPVVTAVCTTSADVGPDCLRTSCCNDSANTTSSKPVPVEVSMSTKVAESSRLYQDFGDTFVTSQAHCALSTSDRFDASGFENHGSKLLGVLCSDGNNNKPVDSVCVSDTGPILLKTECSEDRNLPQRQFRGFAASSPLRDSGLSDMNCSLSSISLASDQEDFDITTDTFDDVESEDDVLLLDVAFVSEDQHMPLQPAASSDAVQSQPRSSFHKTDVRQKSCQRLSQKSPTFQPVSTNNWSISRSCRVSNLPDCGSTRCLALSDRTNPGVRRVPTKRTHQDVVTISSSDSEDGISTKKNSITVRNTRPRLSCGAKSSDSSICLGPGRCTKAMCFRCHCF